MTEYEVKEIFEMPHKLELISEEKLPSLYSLSSYTNSVCSDSTIDLAELDQIGSTTDAFSYPSKKEPKPLQNNFLNEKPMKTPHNEQAVEDDALEPCIKPVEQLSHNTFSKSVSLLDVSSILPLNLTAKSNTVSCETINSHSLSSTTKSKDSGFQRSLSCLSLTSGKKSYRYDHVQSKVKAYIKNIKDSEALNKRNKLLQKQETKSKPIISEHFSEDVVEKDDLLREIQELKHELNEKSLYIEAQQRNYNKLLLKFAEARNIIDKLRVQSLSFDYSVGNDTKDQTFSLSNVHHDSSDYKVQFSQLRSGKPQENSMEKDIVISSETTCEIVQENFKPHTHSSPYEKSLSPVKKIFSSSSHLDKNYQPLMNLKHSNPQIGKPERQNHFKGQNSADSCDYEMRNGGFKLNNQSNVLRRQSMNIDLPNDDPFDKVKKWQASLPSINLLGSCSSSDCEELKHNLPLSSERCFKKSESNSSKCCFPKKNANESEICNILSLELKKKCVITEMEVGTEPRAKLMKNNQDVSKNCESKKQVCNSMISRRLDNNEESSHFIKNKYSASKTKHTLNPKKQNKINNPLNFLTRVHSEEVIYPSLGFVNTNVGDVSSRSRESSLSEDGITRLPKPSLMSSCIIDKAGESDMDYNDSSSISSSLLGSESTNSEKSPVRAKRRLVLCKNNVSNKIPKTTKSKSSQTTFVLREPKFNFTSHFETSESQLNNKISSKNKSTNHETWSKHRSSNNHINGGMKTESSQRKAWNERNNENFYVCKDPSFTKTSTLIECIKDMEGLVAKGACVLRSVEDRNKATC